MSASAQGHPFAQHTSFFKKKARALAYMEKKL